MSNKTSFRLVVTYAGRVLQDNRFAVSKEGNSRAIKDSIASAMNECFNTKTIKTLKWCGITSTILCDTVSHEVTDVIPAIKWVKEQTNV